MSDVTLTIDGREVSVPAGTGLVEAAAELGVEIPVFCYEPRIGPPVGACRMCLVEIEGVPKLQAACATGVRAGMVVSTVGDKAREAQESVLEFLLVNHPLDCPVCDKGGECPLQDHAFRWGPGASRFGELKRVNDKPIPVSPLIALDRERCILCYRCTRFSDEVTEDQQLVSRQRGANSVIATFEGRPWEGHHAGNVIELCPVGALTSTQFRFRARPWEAPDHPSIATWDPVGTNIFHTVREGEVVRVLSRRNDAVDLGWIDDRTRFAYESLNGPARVRSAMRRTNRERPVGNSPRTEESLEVALEWLHAELVRPSQWRPDPEAEAAGDEQLPPARELWVLSGSETLETVHAVQTLAAQTGGRVVAVPGASAAHPSPEHAARIADLRDAKHVLVVGNTDLLDDAPALELWVREARKAGANVTVAGIGGTRLDNSGARVEHVAPGQLETWVGDFCSRSRDAMGGAAPTDGGVVVFRDGGLSDAALTDLASTFAFPREGSGFLAIPQAPNARGLAALGVETASWEEILGHGGGVIYLGVDPSRHVDRSHWGPSVKRARWVVAVDTLATPLHEAADLVLPAAAAAEQDGTMVNLEGRIQRLTVGAVPPEGTRPALAWIAGLARRMGGTIQGNAASAFRQLAAAHAGNFPVATHGEIGSEGVLGVTGGTVAPYRAVDEVQAADGQLVLYVAPFLYDAAEVSHSPAMDFLRADAKLVMNRSDARSRGLTRGQRVVLSDVDGRDVEATVVTSSRMLPGHARVHAGTPGFAPGRHGWHAVGIRAVSDTPTASITSEPVEA